MRGVNAAVVGLLGAALYNPAFVERGVRRRADFALAATAFVLLVAWRAPPLVVALSPPPPGSAWRALGTRGVNPRSSVP